MTGRRRAAILLAVLLGFAYLVTAQYHRGQPATGPAEDLRVPIRHQELEPDRPDLIGEPGTEPPQSIL